MLLRQQFRKRYMNPRPKYKTRQREVILSYLETLPGEHFTAGDVYSHFNGCGSSKGQATIYRQLESLVDEGLLNKYIIDEKSPACFEYVGESSHVQESVCFHCKCTSCGRLIHLHCDELEGIKSHLLEHHGFALDPLRTVYYGLCEDCAKADGGAACR